MRQFFSRVQNTAKYVVPSSLYCLHPFSTTDNDLSLPPTLTPNFQYISNYPIQQITNTANHQNLNIENTNFHNSFVNSFSSPFNTPNLFETIDIPPELPNTNNNNLSLSTSLSTNPIPSENFYYDFTSLPNSQNINITPNSNVLPFSSNSNLPPTSNLPTTFNTSIVHLVRSLYIQMFSFLASKACVEICLYNFKFITTIKFNFI